MVSQIFPVGIDIFLFDDGLLFVFILYNNSLFWFVAHNWVALFVEVKACGVEFTFEKF